jgi:CubicO group peptidase (beta-lactamase class C family)
VERGLLSLDEPISNVLPEWSEPDILTGIDDSGKPILKKATKPVTLRHLLTHSAGMSYAFMSPLMQKYDQATGKKVNSPRGLIKDDLVYPLVFEPGEGWEYSTGIDWAGQAVERVNGGIRLGEYLKKNVFDPLGIKSTTFQIADPNNQDKRLGHTFRTPEGKAVPDAPDFGMYFTEQPLDDYGGAGLHSSAEEYIKILRSLLIDDGVLLKPESAREIFSPQLKDTKYIQEKMDNPQAAAFLAPSYGAGFKWNHGLGGAVAVEGIEGRLGRGALQWAGLPNSYWVSRDGPLVSRTLTDYNTTVD